MKNIDLFYQAIACHLSLCSYTEEWEQEEEISEQEEKAARSSRQTTWKHEDKETKESLKPKILAKVKSKKRTSKAGAFLLLVLEDVGNNMNETRLQEKLLREMKVMFPSNDYNLKVILTTREFKEGDITEAEGTRVIKLFEQFEQFEQTEPLSPGESLTLLNQLFQRKVSASDIQGLEQLSEAIAKKSMGMRAAIVVIAETLNHIAQHDCGAWTLESALRKAAYDDETPHHEVAAKVNPLIYLAYDMLPCSIMKICFWHSMQLVRAYGGVHYETLIVHWIMEGHFDPVDRIEMAYKKAHNVLMELTDRCLLKVQDDSVIFIEGAVLKLYDSCLPEIVGGFNLGLASVFEYGEGIGRIKLTNGMIKTLCHPKDWQKVSTLLFDGSRRCLEVPQTFLNTMQKLQVLAIFNPRFKSLAPPIVTMKSLLVLVLRNCDLLNDISGIMQLETLTALEISNASHLNSMPNELFDGMKNLLSLNLSGLQIKSLPSSLSKQNRLRSLIVRRCSCLKSLSLIGLDNLQELELSELQITSLPSLSNLHELRSLIVMGCSHLKSLSLIGLDNLEKLDLSELRIKSLPPLSKPSELRFLILRRCSYLEKLPSLEGMVKLQILDLCGSTFFRKFQDKSLLLSLQKLQMIDLSETGIVVLPILKSLKDLTRLLLRDCRDLCRLPFLNELTSLQILDLSGSVKFSEFNDQVMENMKGLITLDLSNTSICELPSIIPCNLFELKLSGCSKLKELPSTTTLKNLELLDVSNAKELIKIKDESFEHLKYLRHLNLSNTKIENCPSLSNLSKLRQLLLKDCLSLKTLPKMEGLERLEMLVLSGCQELVELPDLDTFKNIKVFDLSGCSALKVREDHEYFKHLSHLTELNLDQCGNNSLSEIAVKSLEHMTRIEILKLCGIRKELSFISKLTVLTNLRQLSLKDCSGLQTLQFLGTLLKLEVLDLSGSESVGSLPSSLENLTNLQELHLVGCSSLKELPSLKSLINLKVLDLSNTGIKKLSNEISELNCLKGLPEDAISWENCNIFKFADIQAYGKKPSILVNSENFKLLKGKFDLQEASIRQIRLSEEDMFCNIFFSTKEFPSRDDIRSMNALFLDVRGFKSIPDSVKDILEKTESVKVVSFSEITFLESLSLVNIKGCWLQRCPTMHCIFGSKEDIIKWSETLETLSISNLLNLKSLCGDQERQLVVFKNLTHLRLDCCPNLEKVFCSSQFLVNLEILQIKFCDSLKTVFEGNESDMQPKLPKLHTLLLFNLPELTTIGVTKPVKVKIIECPKLDKSENSLKSAEIVDSSIPHENLR